MDDKFFPDDNSEDVYSYGFPSQDFIDVESSTEQPFKVKLPKSVTDRTPKSAPVSDAFRSPKSVPTGSASRTPTSAPVSAASRTPASSPAGNPYSSRPTANRRPAEQDNPFYQAEQNAGYRVPRQNYSDVSSTGASYGNTQRATGRPTENIYSATPGSNSGSVQSSRTQPVRNDPPKPQFTRPEEKPQPQRQTYGDVKSGKAKDKPKKKKHTGRKIVVSLLCIILALIVGIGAYGMSLVSKLNIDDSTSGDNEYISDSELASSSAVKNILLIGSDNREDVSGMRSDTMILVSIDTKNHQLKLTSFMRDSFVKIPAKNAWNKLNAAYSFGGAKMLIDTIEYNFKVKIDNYVRVDFVAFTDFINAMGGVTIDGITEAEVNYLKKNVDGININTGTSHLTGGAALWYCRIRYLDSDFKRTERQRKVVSAVLAQVKKNPVKAMSALEDVMEEVSTDIPKNNVVLLGLNGLVRYLSYDIYQAQVPADGTWWDATYSCGMVLEMKIDKNAEILKDFIYNKQTKTESEE